MCKILVVCILTASYWPFTVDNLNLDGLLVTVNSWQSTVNWQLLMVKCWWIWTIQSWELKSWWCGCWRSTTISQLLTVHSWLSTFDGYVLIDLDRQELSVQILMVRVFMFHHCWSNLGSPLLTINNRWSSADGFRPSIVDSLKVDNAEVAGLLLLFNSWQSIVNHQLLMMKCWLIWNFQNWQSKFWCARWWWFTIAGQLLATKCCWIWTIKNWQSKSWCCRCWWFTIVGQVLMNLDHQKLTVQILVL